MRLPANPPTTLVVAGPSGPEHGVAAMDVMRQIAYATVMRACGFGSLAIFCFMVGLSFAPRLAFQMGGMLTMLMTGILFVKAIEARWKHYRRTEMWLYL